MSIISPKSSEFVADSSVAFVKPMPQREDTPHVVSGDSAEFDVGGVPPNRSSTLELWRKLLPDADEPQPSQSRCAGVTLGHFRLEEQIGRGGMGAVFRAIDTRLDREVALKVLAGSHSADRSSVDRFLNEARAAARLDHDNVARVYFVGEDQGLHFIAFEFIHGANVRQVIDARGVLSAMEAVNYGLQIAHALRHIADAGVVHRDVKPSNIIITPTGRGKLVDLGLARKHDPEASKDLTVDGTTLGTFDYISPEQAKDPRKVDIRSDIYSLGCTLYHMLTGEPPYPQGTMLQKLLDHQGKDVPAAADRNRNVPPELSAVVKKMMASNPSERYGTADELIGDLSILAHAYGLQPTAPGSLIWTAPERPNGWTLLQRNRAWLATAGLLVFAVFVIDAFQSDPRSSSPELAARDESVESASSTSQLSPSRQGTGELSAAPDSADSHSLPSGIVHLAQPSPDFSSTGNSVWKPLESQFQLQYSPPLISEGPSGLQINELSSSSETESATDTTAQSLATDSGPSRPAAAASLATDQQSAPETSTGDDQLPDQPFVVRIDNQSPKGYPSLEAACRDAPDGSSVELNFDGDLGERQRPVRWTGKRLLIRAAADRRPVVRFSVPEGLTADPVVRMIEVTEGALEVYNVDFIMEIDPAYYADRWVLLSLEQADAVTLRGVSVTIDKPQLTAVAAAIVQFAESQPAFGNRMPEIRERPPLRFEAEDCFFRGDADLFLNENVDLTRIRLSNVAAALGGAVIRILGTSVDVSMDSSSEHLVELELQNVTASLASAMVSFEVDNGSTVPRLAVTAGNSVFEIDGTHPLVRMIGDVDPDIDPFELLEWSGGNCFVQTDDPIWSITGLYDDERAVSLADWNDLWEEGRLDRRLGARLLLRDPSTLDSEVTAVDLSLNQAVAGRNPAQSGASDGDDAGVRWDSPALPKLSAQHSVEDSFRYIE